MVVKNEIPYVADLPLAFFQAEVPVKYQVDLAVIAIQAAIDVSKRILNVSDFATHALSLSILDQARTTVSHCRTSEEDNVEWLALLSASFYNRGVTLYLGESPVPAIPFIQRSVDIAQIVQQQDTESFSSPETAAALAELAVQYSKRLELLATCHIKKGDKMASSLNCTVFDVETDTSLFRTDSQPTLHV